VRVVREIGLRIQRDSRTALKGANRGGVFAVSMNWWKLFCLVGLHTMPPAALWFHGPRGGVFYRCPECGKVVRV
jgi:hypothetical protein